MQSLPLFLDAWCKCRMLFDKWVWDKRGTRLSTKNVAWDNISEKENKKKSLNIRPSNSIHTAPSHTVFSCYGAKKALLCSMDCNGTTTTMSKHV